MCALRYMGYAIIVVLTGLFVTFFVLVVWADMQYPGAGMGNEVFLISRLMLPGVIAAAGASLIAIDYERGRDWPDDGQTRCRKCAYILKGITEPICPECGEKI